MAKIQKSWTGKKAPTNPIKKEKHDCRKYKTVYLDDLRKKEQQQELKDLLYGNIVGVLSEEQRENSSTD